MKNPYATKSKTPDNSNLAHQQWYIKTAHKPYLTESRWSLKLFALKKQKISSKSQDTKIKSPSEYKAQYFSTGCNSSKRSVSRRPHPSRCSGDRTEITNILTTRRVKECTIWSWEGLRETEDKKQNFYYYCLTSQF